MRSHQGICSNSVIPWCEAQGISANEENISNSESQKNRGWNHQSTSGGHLVQPSVQAGEISNLDEVTQNLRESQGCTALSLLLKMKNICRNSRK